MSKNVAFICPLYDMKNHFDLAFNLLKSKIDFKIAEDIFFVFSNEEQMRKFSNRVRTGLSEEINYLILPAKLEPYKSKVVVKKIYALRTLMGSYDYLSIIDTESIFIKNVDFSLVFSEIWKNGSCLNCNVSPDGFFIQRTCFKTLSNEVYNNPKLRSEFEDYRYNFWFNEIPVYKCSNLPAFFEWLDSFNKEGWMNEWCCFEYYLYAAYLVLHENLHINKFPNIISNGGVMEFLFERPKNEQISIVEQLGTHWSSSKFAINDNICMLFHLDRETSDTDYNFGLDKKKLKYFEKERLKLLKRDSVTDKYPYMVYYYNLCDLLKKRIWQLINIIKN